MLIDSGEMGIRAELILIDEYWKISETPSAKN